MFYWLRSRKPLTGKSADKGRVGGFFGPHVILEELRLNNLSGLQAGTFVGITSSPFRRIPPLSWHWEIGGSRNPMGIGSQRAVIICEWRQSMRASESWQNFGICSRKKEDDSDKAAIPKLISVPAAIGFYEAVLLGKFISRIGHERHPMSGSGVRCGKAALSNG